MTTLSPLRERRQWLIDMGNLKTLDSDFEQPAGLFKLNAHIQRGLITYDWIEPPHDVMRSMGLYKTPFHTELEQLIEMIDDAISVMSHEPLTPQTLHAMSLLVNTTVEEWSDLSRTNKHFVAKMREAYSPPLERAVGWSSSESQ